MIKSLLTIVLLFAIGNVSFSQEADYTFEVCDTLDMDIASPTYLQCVGWMVVPDTVYSFVTNVDGTRKKFDHQDSTGLTFLDEQTWEVPVEFDNIDAGKEMQYYHLKFLASDAGVFPSATVIPIQGSGKPTPSKPIAPGIHMYWFRVKVGLLDYSDAVPIGIMVIKTSKPGQAEG